MKNISLNSFKSIEEVYQLIDKFELTKKEIEETLEKYDNFEDDFCEKWGKGLKNTVDGVLQEYKNYLKIFPWKIIEERDFLIEDVCDYHRHEYFKSKERELPSNFNHKMFLEFSEVMHSGAPYEMGLNLLYTIIPESEYPKNQNLNFLEKLLIEHSYKTETFKLSDYKKFLKYKKMLGSIKLEIKLNEEFLMEKLDNFKNYPNPKIPTFKNFKKIILDSIKLDPAYSVFLNNKKITLKDYEELFS